jgi:hypothetical protein
VQEQHFALHEPISRGTLVLDAMWSEIVENIVGGLGATAICYVAGYLGQRLQKNPAR